MKKLLMTISLFASSVSFAQSTGGGGGGDRPGLILISMARPLVVRPEQMTCHELSELVEERGKVRINGLRGGQPVFRVLESRSSIACHSNAEVRPVYLKTTDRQTCLAAYECRLRFSR